MSFDGEKISVDQFLVRNPDYALERYYPSSIDFVRIQGAPADDTKIYKRKEAATIGIELTLTRRDRTMDEYKGELIGADGEWPAPTHRAFSQLRYSKINGKDRLIGATRLTEEESGEDRAPCVLLVEVNRDVYQASDDAFHCDMFLLSNVDSPLPIIEKIGHVNQRP